MNPQMSERYRDGLHDALAEMEQTRAEIERLTALLAEAMALIRCAAEDSMLSSGEGMGCFFCDCAEHDKSCAAAAWLAAQEQAK